MAMATPTEQSATAASTHTNPLTAPWTGPHGGVPPWDWVRAKDFPEAFAIALAAEQAEVAAVAARPDPPTFENTIAALQRAGQTKDRVVRLFDVMCLNLSSPAYHALDQEWQPTLAAAEDAIVFHPGLFERIDAVYRSREQSGLRPDQIRLTTIVRDRYLRSGAQLEPSRRARLSEINQALAQLYSTFRGHILAEEDTWTLLSTEADLVGLPDSLVSAAASAARERGFERGWAILNTRSSVDPFLTFSARRDLREIVWRRFKNRGDSGGAHDTNATIVAIVRLRAERATLVGYPSHAHLQMAETMAAHPDAAKALLEQVWAAAVARVRIEVAAMHEIAAQDDPTLRIEPWDYLYYSERVRQAKYALDYATVSAHFTLEQMLQAVMWAAERQYDIAFTEVTGQVPVFHPDVRVFTVADRPSGRFRGLYYLDTFARPAKRSGAWASSYREQYHMDGPSTPIASVNNNFLKTGPGEPVRLSLEDAQTLFHEFGHTLHALLQDVTYPGLADTPRDFVELPSQINERWLLTPELLDRFARHATTGAKLPQSMLDTLATIERSDQGYRTAEAVSAALLDLELHTRSDGHFEPRQFEREMLAQIGMPHELALRHRLPHFDHLFGSDAYSGQYYCYLWADVMSADGWQAFLEGGGPWSKDVADRFRRYILSDGNSSDRADAYRRFRGRDPRVDALLRERGLVEA